MRSFRSIPCIRRLRAFKRRRLELPREGDTVTMYLGPAASESVADALVALRPRRVIFNPGSESAPLEERLRQVGVEVERSCTLVLLQTGQY